MSVATVRIKVKPCKGNEDGIVLLNEADYDPKKHELYDPAKEAALKAEAEKAEQERLEKEAADAKAKGKK